MSDSSNAGLSGVVVGDIVLIEGNNMFAAGKVLRITPRGYVVVSQGKSEYTFRPDGGERSSDSWNRRTCRPMMAEDRAIIVLENQRAKVRRAFDKQAGSLSLEQCGAILKILEGGAA